MIFFRILKITFRIIKGIRIDKEQIRSGSEKHQNLSYENVIIKKIFLINIYSSKFSNEFNK